MDPYVAKYHNSLQEYLNKILKTGWDSRYLTQSRGYIEQNNTSCYFYKKSLFVLFPNHWQSFLFSCTLKCDTFLKCENAAKLPWDLRWFYTHDCKVHI